MTTARSTLARIGSTDYGRLLSGLAGLGLGLTSQRSMLSRRRSLRMPGRGTFPGGNMALWVGVAVAALPIMAMLTRRRTTRRRGKTVEDVMIDSVMTVDVNATLTDAAQRMREGNIGVLPVLENGKLIGIVTDRDLVVRGLARGVDPRTTHVAECATDQPMAARADWSVDDAMEVMASSRIGRLPVVDAQRHVIGIVTLSSLALRSRNQDEALQTARAVSQRSARSA
jgi:CBS domain-containing protein